MTYRTGTLHAGGTVARNTHGRNPQAARWPLGTQHAVDRHGRALCGAPVNHLFDESWDADGGAACGRCAELAGHVDRVAGILQEGVIGSRQ